MRFLLDAQLPRKLSRLLATLGHDSIHTLDLPNQNRTSDAEINLLAASHDRVVVTKDADFVDSHLLLGQPPKLLLVSTGNIANEPLLTLFQNQLDLIEEAFQSARYVELTRESVVAHG
jgi:predicted nuclease of predicted toxin-antitoxin system